MNPVAFEVGPITLHWYGMLVAAGFLAGLALAAKRSKREGFTLQAIRDLGPWLIGGAIVGARAFHVVSYWKEAYAGRAWSEIFMVHKGGLVYYGGLVGATIAGWCYLRWKNLPVLKMADALAPSIPVGYVFGRVGCLMNGCCYGRFCEMPWAIHYPEQHPTHGAPVHPTQIYDAIFSVGLWLMLEWFYRRKRFDGHVFGAYLIGYAILRSTVELFRGDYSTAHLNGWVTPGQAVSIGIFAAGVALLFWLGQRAGGRTDKVRSS